MESENKNIFVRLFVLRTLNFTLHAFLEIVLRATKSHCDSLLIICYLTLIHIPHHGRSTHRASLQLQVRNSFIFYCITRLLDLLQKARHHFIFVCLGLTFLLHIFIVKLFELSISFLPLCIALSSLGLLGSGCQLDGLRFDLFAIG